VQLGVREPSEEFVLSLFDYSRLPCALAEPLDYDLGEIALAGVGAIGNAAVWLLARSQCKGRIHLIDPETLDDTNPQRYVLTDAKSEGEDKVTLAARELGSSKVQPLPHKTTWGSFIGQQPGWKIPMVAVALDSPEDRVAVQASLPKWVLNSWTQANDLGVSRHEFNSDSACLACMYWPKKQKRNLDEIIKEAIRYSGELMDVRNMLYFGTGLDDAWLEKISRDMGQPRELLEPFKGKTIDAFYREAICGGHVIATEGGKIEVLGETVGLVGHSSVDVSGPAGGGRALIGGDYQGKNPAIPNAQRTLVGANSVRLVPVLPSVVGMQIVIAASDNERAGALFSLPFGLRAYAQVDPIFEHIGFHTLVALIHEPSFHDLKSAQQVRLSTLPGSAKLDDAMAKRVRYASSSPQAGIRRPVWLPLGRPEEGRCR